nr:NAD-dependent epimerase/dehydratase family protein [Rhodoblastus sp.]
MIDSSFWRDRRVFVTGHTGFKGAWLSLMLERLCARVTGYGLAPATEPSLYELARAGENLCDVRGDVCDAAMLDGALRAADPDIVIHLAGRPPRDGAPASAQAVERLKKTGGPDVLEATLRAPSVQAAVFVSPESAYVSLDWIELTSESDAHVVSLHCPDPIGGGDFAAERGAEPKRFGHVAP